MDWLKPTSHSSITNTDFRCQSLDPSSLKWLSGTITLPVIWKPKCHWWPGHYSLFDQKRTRNCWSRYDWWTKWTLSTSATMAPMPMPYRHSTICHGYAHVMPLSSLSWIRFGVSGCLLDYFEAPDAVKTVLDAECGLSGAVVGPPYQNSYSMPWGVEMFFSRESSQHAMELFASDQRIRRLFTPSRVFTITRSNYSNKKSMSTSQLYPAQLLGSNHLTSDEHSDLHRKSMKIQEVTLFSSGLFWQLRCQQCLASIQRDEEYKVNAYREFEAAYHDVKVKLDDINQERKDAEKRQV